MNRCTMSKNKGEQHVSNCMKCDETWDNDDNDDNDGNDDNEDNEYQV